MVTVSTPPLFLAPVAGLVPINADEANRLVGEWGHNLGPCNRPYRLDGWALLVDDEPVSVAISASTVSPTIRAADGRVWRRTELIELARQCSHPAHRWATRPMLRLWREVATRHWCWPATMAVSYSDSRHAGDMYRFDGWELLAAGLGRSHGGGQWSGRRSHDHPTRGPKQLWGWQL